MAIDIVLLRFLQGVIRSSEPKQISAIAKRCSEDFKIGTRAGRHFSYDAKDVADAISLLQSHGLPLTESDIKSRADSSNRPGISEKHGAPLPHDDSVAFRMFSGGSPKGLGYSVDNASEVAALPAEIMMVVENFETFRQLHKYKWVMQRLEEFKSCIAVFRGDSVYSTGDSVRCVQACNLPKIGFHDFDPAGLSMSAKLQGLVEHLMPPLQIFESAILEGKRSDLYFSQLAQYSDGLNKANSVNIADAWNLMKRMQKGYPQEWMRDLA